MKNILKIIVMLVSIASFSQKTLALDTFESINHSIAGTVQIKKSNQHKIVLIGKKDIIKHIEMIVINKTLNIKSKKNGLNFEKVTIKIYTPSVISLKLNAGGIVSMDKQFSKIEHFSVSIQNGGEVDFSNIEFQNLNASVNSGGNFFYKSSENLVSNIKNGGRITKIKN